MQLEMQQLQIVGGSGGSAKPFVLARVAAAGLDHTDWTSAAGPWTAPAGPTPTANDDELACAHNEAETAAVRVCKRPQQVVDQHS